MHIRLFVSVIIYCIKCNYQKLASGGTILLSAFCNFVKVQSFKTRSEVDEWLLNHPMHCSGALHFMEINSSVISYGIQTNSTPLAKRGNYEDPTFKFQIPFQIAVEREIARSLVGGIALKIAVLLEISILSC